MEDFEEKLKRRLSSGQTFEKRIISGLD